MMHHQSGETDQHYCMPMCTDARLLACVPRLIIVHERTETTPEPRVMVICDRSMHGRSSNNTQPAHNIAMPCHFTVVWSGLCCVSARILTPDSRSNQPGGVTSSREVLVQAHFSVYIPSNSKSASTSRNTLSTCENRHKSEVIHGYRL
jgi:hypothetical protein